MTASTNLTECHDCGAFLGPIPQPICPSCGARVHCPGPTLEVACASTSAWRFFAPGETCHLSDTVHGLRARRLPGYLGSISALDAAWAIQPSADAARLGMAVGGRLVQSVDSIVLVSDVPVKLTWTAQALALLLTVHTRRPTRATP